MEKSKKNTPETEEPFKTIKVFSSFEEAEEYEIKQRAELSHDKRLEHVEILRKRVFH